MKEFDELCKRKGLEDKRGDYSTALIASSIYNAHRTSNNQKFLTPGDFIGSESKNVSKTSMEMKEALKLVTTKYERRKNGCRTR